ncbi:MAG: hypothetical protein COA58_07830 [Bacteroidetes bacterium]|nr:MAG: hypothetical protein COA58_07830 [Bacteroidota bacterium]
MFRYLVAGVLIYWIGKRLFKISKVIKDNSSVPPPKTTSAKKPISDKTNRPTKGEYVDYEEVDQ